MIDLLLQADALGEERLGQVHALLLANPARAAELARLLLCSRFALREFERHPDLLPELLGSGDLERSYAEGEYLQRARMAIGDAPSESRLQEGLRTLRRREMLRILWRERAALSGLVETTAELSALADAALERALESVHADLAARHGEPVG